MKSFSCGDVVPGCDARFLGSTDDQVLREVAAHASSEHEMDTVPAEVVEAVRDRIHETA